MEPYSSVSDPKSNISSESQQQQPQQQQQQCHCESLDEKARVKCFADVYTSFMKRRGRTLNDTEIAQFEKARIAEITLYVDFDKNATTGLAESQIIFTFMNGFLKNHPKLARSGFSFGELTQRSDFFQST